MKEKGEPIMGWEGRIVVLFIPPCDGDLANRTGRIDIAEIINCMLSCEGVVCILAAR